MMGAIWVLNPTTPHAIPLNPEDFDG